MQNKRWHIIPAGLAVGITLIVGTGITSKGETMKQLDLTQFETERDVDPSVIGTIFGENAIGSFRFGITGKAGRSDYVVVEHPDCGNVLCQIDSIIKKSNYTLEMSLSQKNDDTIVEKTIGSCVVIGYRDSNGLLVAPKSPFDCGSEVRTADPAFIKRTLGLMDDPKRGAYIGTLSGYDLRLYADIDSMILRHVAVLASTGAGKSYTSGDIIEELIRHGITCMIIDPYGEYGAMKEPVELIGMDEERAPVYYPDRIHEFAIDGENDATPLRFTLRSLDADDIVELLPSAESRNSITALVKAIENVRARKELYDIGDLVDEIASIDRVKHSILIRDLLGLDNLSLFAERGNSIKELVREGDTTIINLKGYTPDLQQIIIRRLSTMLLEMRKNERIPPMMFVLEEAHAYCPDSENTVCKKAISTISSEGRKFGLGLMLISQRPAKIDGNVLGRCGMHVIHKVTNPNDLKTIASSLEGFSVGMEQEISSLPMGTALVMGAGIPTPVLVDIRARETNHGCADIQITGANNDE